MSDPPGDAIATLAGGVARAGARQRGFTLLELLITLGVTTIGLVGLLALHLGVVRGTEGASRVAEAQQIAAARLEALRAQRLGDLMQTLTGSPAVAIPTPPKVWTVAGRARRPYTVTATAEALPSPGLMRIRVVTTWTEGGDTLDATPPVDRALDRARSRSRSHSLALEVIRTLEEAL